MQGQFEQAIQDLDETIRLDSELAFAYANRALAYSPRGKDREAQLDVKSAVGLGF